MSPATQQWPEPRVPQLPCPYCPRGIPVYNLPKHLRDCHWRSRFTCRTCSPPVAFDHLRGLNDHMKASHGRLSGVCLPGDLDKIGLPDDLRGMECRICRNGRRRVSVKLLDLLNISF